VLHLLLERLPQAQREQKRIILFHLWRLPSEREAIAAVYRQYMESDDGELRFDAMVLLGRVTEPRDQIALYRSCLKDRDQRVRKLALERLAQLEPAELMALKPEIESMLSDPQMPVKQAAMRALKGIGS
jgi:HEAT repeat protein